MSRVVLDANILIATLIKSDAHHGVALAFIRRSLGVPDTLYIPQLTLAEVLVGQLRIDNGEQAQQTIRFLGIEVVTSDPVSALELATLRATTGLKLPDCVVLATAQHLDATLATTDQALARQAARLGVSLAL